MEDDRSAIAEQMEDASRKGAVLAISGATAILAGVGLAVYEWIGRYYVTGLYFVFVPLGMLLVTIGLNMRGVSLKLLLCIDAFIAVIFFIVISES